MTDQRPSEAELRRILEALEEAERRRQFRRMDFFEPYAKQREFLDLGATKAERLLMAANRVGKTNTGAFEAASHATGCYAPWWKGRRFDGPTKGWVCGATSLATRDICQAKLCGEPGIPSLAGTGMVPKESIVDIALSNGVRDAVDSLHVRHKSGGISVVRFKSYEQGRAKFQGEGLDWIWFDEEPPLEIYSEGLTRLGERRGIAWMTFTPIDGPTAVVLRYTNEPSQHRVVIGMTLDDVPEGGHLTADDKKRLEASYLPHEREARARGVPMLGSGRIFTTTEAMIAEAPIEYVPLHWKKLWAVDFGIGHPFAAVLILWEEPNGADVIHVHHVIRMQDALTLVHADAMKRVAAGVPVAWPHDGGERDRNTGEPLATSYRRLGLRMLHEHAAWEDGSLSTEAGILEWDEREKTGRLKVARHLSDWFEERRVYHRKDGKIVKIKDDLMSATRVALMAKRFARAVSLGSIDMRGRERQEQALAKNVDFDVFTGKPFDDGGEGLARNVDFDVFS